MKRTLLVALVACAPTPATKNVVVDARPPRSDVHEIAPAVPTCSLDGGTPTGATGHLRVEHVDGALSFRLIAAEYVLDGTVVMRRGGANQPTIPDASTATIVDADVPATCHRITVALSYFTRSPTPWGYDRVLRMDSAYDVVVGSGGSTVRLKSVDSIGSVTTPTEKRFGVLWTATP